MLCDVREDDERRCSGMFDVRLGRDGHGHVERDTHMRWERSAGVHYPVPQISYCGCPEEVRGVSAVAAAGAWLLDLVLTNFTTRLAPSRRSPPPPPRAASSRALRPQADQCPLLCAAPLGAPAPQAEAR